MSESAFSQANKWANLIGMATKICFERRPDLDSTPFFASTSQAMKARLDHTTQRKLVDGPSILQDLVRPFFEETKYAYDVKTQVPASESSKRYKMIEAWEHGGVRTTQPIYTALQEQIEQRPLDTELVELRGCIEALASELPQDLKEKFGADKFVMGQRLPDTPVSSLTPEVVS